ncbi:BrnA antitoxin family protein [Candidatus Methylospira mobilis]|uniref:BrnA antitoxin family protein n=1 Tax=Candidatus Methylospira mobilis TaxID=1808979 RepID=UPI0028E84793|nr:BrnA antitoxin family protein [Candidatus Methylospira mobilis]WNV05118.1 BrnA antitoxin family protein [Candidatus Methylospira mobilis]
MNENKRVLRSNLAKVAAHVITGEEYDEPPELADEFFDKATWHMAGNAVSPEAGKAADRKKLKRGRPKIDTRKVLVSVRYSPEVLDYFRATGVGWQVRMDAALKEWIDAHPG